MAYEEQDSSRLPASPGAPAHPGAAPEPAPAAENKQDKKLAFLREVIETVLLTLVIFVAVRSLVVNFQVDGDSMRPSLQNGQYLLVNKVVYFHFDLNALKNLVPGQHANGQDVIYLFHPPQRGDIIVFDPPTPSDKPYVKRVIGLPGETITIRERKIYVNGNPLDESYIAAVPGYQMPYMNSGNGEFTVPEGMIYVLGDNRNNSQDSHVFGAVPLDSVIGKAVVSYWPPDHIGLIPHERYAKAGNGK